MQGTLEMNGQDFTLTLSLDDDFAGGNYTAYRYSQMKDTEGVWASSGTFTASEDLTHPNQKRWHEK